MRSQRRLAFHYQAFALDQAGETIVSIQEEIRAASQVAAEAIAWRRAVQHLRETLRRPLPLSIRLDYVRPGSHLEPQPTTHGEQTS